MPIFLCQKIINPHLQCKKPELETFVQKSSDLNVGEIDNKTLIYFGCQY
jgi:hypothetical protein